MEMSNWYKKAEYEIGFGNSEYTKEDLEFVDQYSNKGPVEKYLAMIAMMRRKMHGPEGYHYSSPEEFLLQEGKQYQSQPLTEDEIEYLKTLQHETIRYKMKECFYNAQSLSMCSPKIRYAEGYLFSGIIPVEHGWSVFNGKVLDFTMAHSNDNEPILGVIPDGWEYFGVELPTKSIRHHWSTYGESNPLISNYREKYPLLKEKFQPQD